MATRLRLYEQENTAYLSFYEETERRPCTLDWDVLAQLDEAVTKIAAHIPAYKAVVVQSESPKSFIVGANIAVLETQDEQNIQDWVRNGHRIFGRLGTLDIPVIAKVRSLALGGGLEVAMACDFIIAGENAAFGQPEASLGVMPGWGGTGRLPLLVGPARAKQLFFTGKPIDAKTACAWGLVNEVCAEDALDARVSEIVAQIGQNDARVHGMVKQIINGRSWRHMPDNAFEEAVTSSVCMASESTKMRLQNFFESRRKK